MDNENKFVDFVKGHKHPATPVTNFKNVRDWDQIRRVLLGRCSICDYVVSSDPIKQKELAFNCGESDICNCKTNRRFKSHVVCDLCYSVWQSLYGNPLLDDRTYFSNLDVLDRMGNRERKKRMGIDDGNNT